MVLKVRILYKEVVPEDDKYLEEHGSFPKRLDQLSGEYINE